MKASYTKLEKIGMEIFKEKIKDRRFKASEGWDVPRDSEILIVSGHEKWVAPSLLEEFPRLKYVITRSAGYNHLPLKYLKERGVDAYRLTDYGSVSVAEHAIALMFALAKNLKENEQGYSLPFERAHIPLSLQISGLPIGIIGMGKIGRRIAEFLRPFGGELLAYSRTPKQIEGIKFVSLDRLLQNSKIVFIAAIYDGSNYHMLDRREFSLMPQGAILVNVARGELVNTEALIRAMKEKGIKAGLDVIEGEQTVFENAAGAEKVLAQIQEIRALGGIVTPHNAYYTGMSIQNMVMYAYEIAKALMEGKESDKGEKII